MPKITAAAPDYASIPYEPINSVLDDRLMRMSLSQHGAFVLLEAHCWVEGSLPNDPEELDKLIRPPDPGWMAKHGAPILAMFKVNKAGRLILPELEKQRRRVAR